MEHAKYYFLEENEKFRSIIWIAIIVPKYFTTVSTYKNETVVFPNIFMYWQEIIYD